MACSALLDLLIRVTDVPDDVLVQMRRLHAHLGEIIRDKQPSGD
jgi:hypothetical protein